MRVSFFTMDGHSEIVLASDICVGDFVYLRSIIFEVASVCTEQYKESVEIDLEDGLCLLLDRDNYVSVWVYED